MDILSKDKIVWSITECCHLVRNIADDDWDGGTLAFEPQHVRLHSEQYFISLELQLENVPVCH